MIRKIVTTVTAIAVMAACVTASAFAADIDNNVYIESSYIQGDLNLYIYNAFTGQYERVNNNVYVNSSYVNGDANIYIYSGDNPYGAYDFRGAAPRVF